MTGASTNAWPSLGERLRRAARAVSGAIVDMSTNSVSLARAGQRAVLAEQHLLDLRAVDDHRDHDVGALGHLARRVGDLAAVLGRPTPPRARGCG